MKKEYNYHTRIMGCDFDMTFVADNVNMADDCFADAFALAQIYEEHFSRFDDASELSQLNTTKTKNVSDIFLEVYEVAHHLFMQTHGVFNPLVQVARIGYDSNFEILKKNQKRKKYTNDYNIEFNAIAVTKDRITLQDTQTLDFAGFLKGYVAQKIATKSKSDACVINIGGDLFVRGKQPKTRHCFAIDIIHPYNKNQCVKLHVEDKAVCTSGTYKRHWLYNKKRKHHIIDVDKKDSASSDLVSASVIHDNGAVADAFATIAIIYGAQKAQNFLTAQGCDFVLICQNDDILLSDSLKKFL